MLDNYVYSLHRSKNGKTRWRCPQTPTTKCRATLYTYGKTVKSLYDHNHGPTNQGFNTDDLFPQIVSIIRCKDNK